jgi:hypothetical protein
VTVAWGGAFDERSRPDVWLDGLWSDASAIALSKNMSPTTPPTLHPKTTSVRRSSIGFLYLVVRF